jgi:hypothetical protein
LAGRFNFGSGLVEFGHYSIEGAGHIGSGVTIGHGIDVEAIDSGCVRLHGVSEGDDRTTKPIGVEMFG